MTSESSVTAFNQFALNDALLKALDEVGYETPSPIQAETIPLLLLGRDVLGQAQTGTGKTAAFALPLISNLNLEQKNPQVLVLAPTRELAIQVAEAFQKYARFMKGFHVLPIYGGQDYRGQIRALERGVHVVVGTPGRVMDHMRRGTLKLSELSALVLDEADEMLRMGFIDDVEWILEQTPPERQIALFSATMPQQIRRIATKYLNDPVQITVKTKTTTVETIRQRFWPVGGIHKLDALTRILEAEPFDAMIIFVRTKTATVELAEKLEARGYAAAALNGDVAQNLRERTIDHLKKGKLDILIATDVAARGLDVERISHVVNYDIPYDTEAYVHRIGRTGRAGRQGDAILFVAPREKRLLSAIENATRQKIEMMELPSTDLINNKRIEKFKQRITDTLANEQLDTFTQMIEEYEQEHNVPAVNIAAALAQLLQGEEPFLLSHKQQHTKESWAKDDRQYNKRDRGDRSSRSDRADRSDRGDRSARKDRPFKERQSRDRNSQPEAGMTTYRIEVGHDHDVKPGNIVGAIANEAGLDSKHIGRINIHDAYSTIDLPDGMPHDVLNDLKKVRVGGQPLNISSISGESKSHGKPYDKKRPSDKSPRPSGRTSGKAPAKSSGKFSDKSSDRFGDKPATRSSGRFGDKPAGRSTGKPSGKFSDKSTAIADKPKTQEQYTAKAAGKGKTDRITVTIKEKSKSGDKPKSRAKKSTDKKVQRKRFGD